VIVSQKGILIAGTHSGAGKTTVTLAILEALSRKGLVVQPFKVGPDYIDPTFHGMVTGRASRNLDGWMMGREEVLKSFGFAGNDVDFSLVEGAMGLYDGLRGRSEEGSSAQVAKWLSLPVILVIDAKGLARTAGALVLGLQQFDRQVRIEGIIFNRIGSQNHLEILRESIEATCNVKVLGGIPADSSIAIPERHLGLVHARECFTGSMKSRLADLAEKHLDLNQLLEMGTLPDRHPIPSELNRVKPKPKCKIGIARDEAFFFYYQDNLELLERAGAELIFFSPLHDFEIPEVDSLYFGGGYPELYAETLSQNSSMLESIRTFAEKQGLIYAECGGLMYLSDGIETREGDIYLMAALLPGQVKMGKKLKGLGYREVVSRNENFLFCIGAKGRGHEFHYSEWINRKEPEKVKGWDSPYQLYRGGETEVFKEDGMKKGSILASYVHLHFASNPEIVNRWVAASEKFHLSIS
jgi:cobyrinic acid a,c-diamide synthase